MAVKYVDFDHESDIVIPRNKIVSARLARASDGLTDFDGDFSQDADICDAVQQGIRGAVQAAKMHRTARARRTKVVARLRRAQARNMRLIFRLNQLEVKGQSHQKVRRAMQAASKSERMWRQRLADRNNSVLRARRRAEMAVFVGKAEGKQARKLRRQWRKMERERKSEERNQKRAKHKEQRKNRRQFRKQGNG